MITERPQRIPTRPGKPMFRYYLKILIDRDDFGVIQSFVDLYNADLYIACECLESYTCGSKQKKQEILDAIPGYIQRIQDRGY